MNRSEATSVLSTLISPIAAEEASQARLRNMVRSNQTDWETIIGVANRYLLVPALYSALQKKMLWDDLEDEQLKAYLSTVYLANRERNKNIRRQVDELCRWFQAIGVKVVLLKGAAALSENHYEDIGARVMGDIDILVEADKILHCIDLLKAKGYTTQDTSYELEPVWHHYHRMQCTGRPASLELHRYALGDGSRYLDNDAVWKHIQVSRLIENAYVLRPDYELYHAFLHSEISHDAHRLNRLELRHLHHFCVMAQSTELTRITDTLVDNAVKAIWLDYLYMNFKLFDLPVPPGNETVVRKHYDNVMAQLNRNGSQILKLTMLFKSLAYSFSMERLQKIYHFKGKLYYPFFILVHIFNRGNKYVTTVKAWKNLYLRAANRAM